MNQCTSETCDNPTDLYLCNECVKVLADWINEAMVYLPELDAAIAKQTTISKPSEGGNGSKSGINPGINLDALQLKINLQSIDRTAEEYAKEEYAAGQAWLIELWVKRTRLVVEGEQELPINREAIRDRLAAEVPAELKVKPLMEWLGVGFAYDDGECAASSFACVPAELFDGLFTGSVLRFLTAHVV